MCVDTTSEIKVLVGTRRANTRTAEYWLVLLVLTHHGINVIASSHKVFDRRNKFCTLEIIERFEIFRQFLVAFQIVTEHDIWAKSNQNIVKFTLLIIFIVSRYKLASALRLGNLGKRKRKIGKSLASEPTKFTDWLKFSSQTEWQNEQDVFELCMSCVLIIFLKIWKHQIWDDKAIFTHHFVEFDKTIFLLYRVWICVLVIIVLNGAKSSTR